MLTAWHCPHSTAAAADRWPCDNRSISPARRAHNSKPAALGLLLWAHAGTYGWTDGHSTVTWTQLRTLCTQCQLDSTVKCREFLYRCISSSIYTVGYVPLYLRVGGCVYIHGLFHQWRVHVCNEWANAMDKYIVVNLSLVTGGYKRIKMQEYKGSVICNKIQKVVTPYLQKHCTADSLLTLNLSQKKLRQS